MAAGPPHGWLRGAVGRVRRALDPEAAQDREQLRALGRELRGWRTGGEERLRTVETAIASMARDAAAQQRHLARVRALITKQRDLVAKMARHSVGDSRTIEVEQRVIDRLARLSRSRLPIVVGPWTGEVGFELLYWIPFLQWARDSFALDPERLIVVSRGGVADWYGHITRHYDEIFRHATPDDFHAATDYRRKQQQIRPFDRSVIKAVLRARGVRRAHVLHPIMMYRLFDGFWRYTTTVKRLDAFARFRRLPPIDHDVASGLALPEQFVAVRFYFSRCFPDTPDNRALAARVVDGLAARSHVVLLNSDLVVDDHRDFSPEHRARVHLLSARMRPETNLAVQTAAISRASAFVGTYGGYSYLAPLYGVSSVAFYSRTTFKQHHLELAHRAFHRLGSARLVPVDVGRAAVLADALAGIVTVPAVP